jgi:hypothetical protein
MHRENEALFYRKGTVNDETPDSMGASGMFRSDEDEIKLCESPAARGKLK